MDLMDPLNVSALISLELVDKDCHSSRSLGIHSGNDLHISRLRFVFLCSRRLTHCLAFTKGGKKAADILKASCSEHRHYCNFIVLLWGFFSF